MKVLITGANGQLGLSLKKVAPEYPQVIFEFTDIEELDITDHSAVEHYISGKHFTHIINCAAYTAVDKAEDEPQKARLINVNAVHNLSKISAKNDLYFIQISTDYVFDGHNYRPYLEEEKPNPAGVYSATKAEGEKIALQTNNRTIVIRTSWLFSEFGQNFLKTIHRLANERDELKIVCDQIGSPTYATHLARGILEFVLHPDLINDREIFHFSNEGVASWYDFAIEIVKLSEIQCNIIPIPTEGYPVPAPRPFYSVLSKQKFTERFAYKIPHWKEGVKECLSLFKDEN
ncbi:MAG: dTDP-4-dehydrorhamnose reductase [Bacteroidetes bacterium]|nr:dTDP-4-dehydrorhamnose reductase [Bacteroidota bacterium]